MTRLIIFLLGTAACLALAAIPELVMWFTYGLISPTTELGRIIVLMGFWIAGSGVCVGFAMLAFALWCAIASAVMEA